MCKFSGPHSKSTDQTLREWNPGSWVLMNSWVILMLPTIGEGPLWRGYRRASSEPHASLGQWLGAEHPEAQSMSKSVLDLHRKLHPSPAPGTCRPGALVAQLIVCGCRHGLLVPLAQTALAYTAVCRLLHDSEDGQCSGEGPDQRGRR